MKHLNIQKNPDLMACPRRPPKKWRTLFLKVKNLKSFN
jgi:hypothetical protein